jgi:hypothetical protein
MRQIYHSSVLELDGRMSMVLAERYAEQSARRHLRRAARHVAGWSLLALGVVGLFLPILQGWLFIAVAALLLAPDVPVFRRLLDWIEFRFPPLRALIRKSRKKS